MDIQEESAVERLKLYSVQELLGLCDPPWLIKRLFRVGAFVVLYGPSGEGKTFLALDWALSIACGGPWNGLPTTRGAVVYVAAEGGRSIRKRVKAWLLRRELSDLSQVFFLLEDVQVGSPQDLFLLQRRISESRLDPVLIVFDTFARCFVGGDENAAKDMGQFVDAIARLQQTTGSAVLVVHHSPRREPAHERGSSALRGAADAMVLVRRRKNGPVEVSNSKQKDDEEFGKINLVLRQMPLGHDEDGEIVTSCVLESDTEPEAISIALGCLQTLIALLKFPDGEASTSEWIKKAERSERTLHDHRRKLEGQGLVEEVKRGRYRATDQGREAATARFLQ